MTVPCSQVLMGLNFSQLTCHFTSTANLTACQLPATRWHAYTRATDASTAAAFDVSAGFLGAGDDARAPAELSVAGCEAACVGLASCRGFTFQAGGARAVVGLACIPISIIMTTTIISIVIFYFAIRILLWGKFINFH